ncbi:hypothetical protein GCM10023187_46710 [Nibrella viscosa]|uniref:Heavy-metal resistance n=1 Tax=Nibrella viscosa TaxID=1084524 RepID=A0ABP8KTJ9_9BACT
MERTKLLTFAVIGLLLLNLFTVGYLVLRPGPPPHPDRPPGPPDEGPGPANLIIDRLRLNPEQTRHYRQLVDQHRRQTHRLNNDLIQTYGAYYQLLAAPQPDTLQAAALLRQLADQNRALAQLNYSHFAQIKALCRPDQQAAFDSLLRHITAFFGRGPRPPEPPPEGF